MCCMCAFDTCLLEFKKESIMNGNIISFFIDSSTKYEDRIVYFRHISEFLSGLECNYPFFNEWLDKVYHELSQGKRTVIILVDKPSCKIIGLAILKDSIQEKKICTLRVAASHQHQGCGSYLIEQSIRLLKDPKPLITVSEEHVDAFKPLFRRFGFKIEDRVKSVYCDNKYEYYYNKPYQKKFVLMSIKPQYANAIMCGQKKVEFRRQIFDVNVERVYVYASFPMKKLIGYFEVDKVICDFPDFLWKQFGKMGSIAKGDFFSYFNNCNYGYAIVIKSVCRFSKDCLISEVFGDNFRVPQSYRYINNITTIRKLSDL